MSEGSESIVKISRWGIISKEGSGSDLVVIVIVVIYMVYDSLNLRSIKF